MSLRNRISVLLTLLTLLSAVTFSTIPAVQAADVSELSIDQQIEMVRSLNEAARQATGNLNKNGFEINGTKGSLRFNFERMSELEYCDAAADASTFGWTTINCSKGGAHPYAEAWWPDAHPIGYEHTFTNMAYNFLLVLAGKKPVVPVPDFEDAYRTQRVLEAALVSARKRRAVKLSEIR